MIYSEEDMLMLSGIQHYMFCPRQWALIHIEQQWAENRLTVEGHLLHINVDNPSYRQKNGVRLTLRSVSIASKILGLYGLTDAIELLPSNDEHNSIKHANYAGNWQPYPIEYKRGHKKIDKSDEVQLTAQVMCLEEMYDISLSEAAFYYGETKHREVIKITSQLRELTTRCADEMHQLYRKSVTPKAVKKASCKSCSLIDICMPQIVNKGSVINYLKHNLYEEVT